MSIRSLCLYGAVLLLSGTQVAAHAAINPALGVSGTAARNDVERPSNNNPCGGVDIAGAIDGSTAVQADASGSFTVDVENFNGYVSALDACKLGKLTGSAAEVGMARVRSRCLLMPPETARTLSTALSPPTASS